jgi:hypothetical protein
MKIKIPTLKDFGLEKLSVEQLKSLMPAHDPLVRTLIEDKISKS